MAEFSGAFEGLEGLVREIGYVGQWNDITDGKQFKSRDGAIFNWYSSTGRLLFQGKKEAQENVVLEMGMLIAALGRPNVAKLKKGHIENPSDATGILTFHSMVTLRS